MRCAQRTKRVSRIDMETRPSCAGLVKVIACIEDRPVIDRILTHLADNDFPGLWPVTQAPPGPVGLLQ